MSLVPTAGYDDAGNMTVYELAPGESLPPGVHPIPPPGTHPNEIGLVKRDEPVPEARTADPPLETRLEPLPQPVPPPPDPPPLNVFASGGRVIDMPQPRRGPGRPRNS